MRLQKGVLLERQRLRLRLLMAMTLGRGRDGGIDALCSWLADVGSTRRRQGRDVVGLDLGRDSWEGVPPAILLALLVLRVLLVG